MFLYKMKCNLFVSLAGEVGLGVGRRGRGTRGMEERGLIDKHFRLVVYSRKRTGITWQTQL